MIRRDTNGGTGKEPCLDYGEVLKWGRSETNHFVATVKGLISKYSTSFFNDLKTRCRKHLC